MYPARGIWSTLRNRQRKITGIGFGFGIGIDVERNSENRYKIPINVREVSDTVYQMGKWQVELQNLYPYGA